MRSALYTGMKRLLPVVLLAACGSSNSSEPETPYALCDGSDGVRLAIMNGGGQLETNYPFTNPYGWQFLFLTGRCEFIAQPDVSANSGLLTGTFTSAQAEELAVKLAPLSGKSYRAFGGCSDATTTQVITGDGYAEGVCGDEPPALVKEALSVVSPAFELARGAGTPLGGPVEVVAIGDYYKLSAADAVAWPFSWPIEQASVLWSSTNGAADLLAHARTLTGDDAAIARQLRSDANASPAARGNMDVTSGGKDYALFMRDQVDPALNSAITAFRAANDPYIPKPIALCDTKRVLEASFDTPSLYGKTFSASTQQELPCDAQLCWDGSFREESPVSTSLRVERAEQPRSCLGDPPYTSLSTDLQPLIDAYHAGYPNQPVVIDVSLVGAQPGQTTLRED